MITIKGLMNMHQFNLHRFCRLTCVFLIVLCFSFSGFMSGSALSQSTSDSLKDPSKGERIAVLSLRNRIKMSKEEVDYLTGLVRRIISKRLSRTYLIMTQENIEVLLPPNTNLDDCVSECQVETGRTIGARYIITGDVLRFGSSLRLTLRMHDTRSGRLVASEVAKASKIDDLEAPTERAVETLINQIDGSRLQSTSDSSPSNSRDDLGSSLSGRDTSVVRDDRRRPQKLTRRERLLRRARAAEAERKRRQEEKAQRRRRRRAQKSRKTRPQVTKVSATQRTVQQIESEMSFGFAGSQCDNTDDFNCDAFDSNLAFDLALDYTLIYPEDPDLGWTMSLDLRYAHSSFSGSDSFSSSDYTMNTLTVGALGGIKLSDFYIRALFGLGYSFGTISVVSERGEFDTADFDIESTSGIIFGFDLGWQLSPEWMISVYQQTLDSLEDPEVCDFFGDTCQTVQLPSISQQGVRLTLLF